MGAFLKEEWMSILGFFMLLSIFLWVILLILNFEPKQRLLSSIINEFISSIIISFAITIFCTLLMYTADKILNEFQSQGIKELPENLYSFYRFNQNQDYHELQ